MCWGKTYGTEKAWKDAVMAVATDSQTLLRDKLKGTQWADIKVFNLRSKVIDGQTVAMQTIARVPVTARDASIKP